MPPEIETARLRLYPPRPEDLEARLAMDRDPEVMRFIRPIPEDAAAQRADIRAALDGPPGRGALWHVEERAAPRFIGWCGVFPLQDSGLMEIGYRFLRAAWGRGFATEAAAALDHGFRELKLDPIVAVSDTDNAASHRVLHKIGLRAAGTARHYGRELPFFELRRGEYSARA